MNAKTILACPGPRARFLRFSLRPPYRYARTSRSGCHSASRRTCYVSHARSRLGHDNERFRGSRPTRRRQPAAARVAYRRARGEKGKKKDTTKEKKKRGSRRVLLKIKARESATSRASSRGSSAKIPRHFILTTQRC
ncbi:hypothetical protein PUN28_003225 [Cardiocondyla obscurior]|uniref:Uncharacterized protein n=1 Tax=Cardiocondyla obscurior TaxID=286306 RepID=A0AAW2GJV5_9HYME